MAARYPSKKAFAAALEIDAGHLNHVMGGQGPFGVRTCLRLAALIDQSPVDILRLADKDEEATLIEAAYYAPRHSDLTATQRQLLVIWDRIPPAAWPVRNELLRALEQLATMPARSRRPRARRQRGRSTAHK